jgi:hypothetical protein
LRVDTSMEGLKKLYTRGWHFFIRTVKGRRYVTVRRKGKEKSLGPYSEELWSRVVKVDESKLGVSDGGKVNNIPNHFPNEDSTVDEIKRNADGSFTVKKLFKDGVDPSQFITEPAVKGMTRNADGSWTFFGNPFLNKGGSDQGSTESAGLDKKDQDKPNVLRENNKTPNRVESGEKFFHKSLSEDGIASNVNGFNGLYSNPLYLELLLYRAKKKVEKCIYNESDGFCHLRLYSELPGFIEALYMQQNISNFKKSVLISGKSWFIVKACGFFCVDCFDYDPKNDFLKLKQ